MDDKSVDKPTRCARRVDLTPEPGYDEKYFYCGLRSGHAGQCKKPKSKGVWKSGW